MNDLAYQTATKVMGLHEGMHGCWLRSNDLAFCALTSWHPDTDIPQAFMLVEEMNKRGFVMTMWTTRTRTAVVFAHSTEPYDKHTEGSDSAPKSICLAALAAIGESDG